MGSVLKCRLLFSLFVNFMTIGYLIWRYCRSRMCLYKSSFGTERYLKSISNPKLRVALSKSRASSHDLEIGRGRFVRPKLNVDGRLRLSYNVVENEEHFINACKDNEVERALFTNKLEKRISSLVNLTNKRKIHFSNDVCRFSDIAMVWKIYIPILYEPKYA